jgi:tRNA(Arg) A34 adenosine deaminase TadA
VTIPQIDDEGYMGLALAEAAKAAEAGDVPIGCVVVRAGKVVGRAHNQVELLKDATAHAEMIALTQAAAAAGDWRLDGAVLYATKEPCPMCAGAILKSRVSRVVFGAEAPLDGAAGRRWTCSTTRAWGPPFRSRGGCGPRSVAPCCRASSGSSGGNPQPPPESPKYTKSSRKILYTQEE